MQLHKDDSDDIDMEMEGSDFQDSTDEEGTVLPDVQLRNHRLPLTCVCIDSQNKFMFSASKDGSIIKWCLDTKRILAKVNSITKSTASKKEKMAERFHVNHINAIAISWDDKFLATGGWDKRVRIWCPDKLTWIHTFTLHRKEITTLAFRRGHHTLYSGSMDKSVMLWTLEDDDNRCFVDSLIGHESAITSMDTSRRERVLTSGGLDQSIRVWKIVEGAQTVFQSKHGSADVARYIDDQTFISGGEDGSLTLWTTMKRSPMCSVSKAHGIDEKTKLSNWIVSIATYSMKAKSKKRADNVNIPTKRRRLDDDLVLDEEDDDSDASDESEKSEEDDEDGVENLNQQAGCQGVSDALVATGSWDSKLRVWKVSKNNLAPYRTFDCPGFINDLKFTSDGKKLIAACGSSHRFGRWTVMKGAKNALRVFELD